MDISLIRAQIPALSQAIYLNTGTCGPLPRAALEVMQKELAQEGEEGRIRPEGFAAMKARMAELRRLLGRIVGAQEEEVALTSNATHGVNIVLWGLDWQKRDEILTTDAEHAGVLAPLRALSQRFDLEVRLAEVSRARDEEEMLLAVEKAITSKTRLFCLSHVTYSTGACLPLEKIAGLAQKRQIPVLADGAQSAGAIALDLSSLGVDFYAFPGQKWLLGPEGTGGLYVKRSGLLRLLPAFAGYFSADPASICASDPARLSFWPDARRFESASLFRPGISGLAASAAWLLSLGMEDITSRTQDLARLARQKLLKIPGVDVLTPEPHRGLVNFRIPKDPAQAVAALAQEGILIRSIPDNQSLRFSCGFFNTEEEIEKAVWAIARLIGKG